MSENEISTAANTSELSALLGRLRMHADNKTKTAMQHDGERAADEIERLRAALKTVKGKLRVDDPHDLYDLVCNALRPNV